MVNDETATPLALAIRDAGLSQADLARRIGVSPSAVSWWVSGDRQPSGPARRLLAMTLGRPLSEVDSWFDQPAALAAAGGSR